MSDILRRTRYAGLDFQTAYDELVSRLQTEYGVDFAALAPTDPLIVLLDLVAYASDTLGFALDRNTTDLYADTVVSPYAANLVLRERGYKRRGRAPAATRLSVSVPDVFSTPVPIPAGTQFRHTETGYIFTTVADVLFSPAETGGAATKEVDAFQGRVVSEAFVSSGEPRQRFTLRRGTPEETVAQGSAYVTVNGSPYSQVDFLRPGMSTSYEVEYTGDTPTVRFGTTTAGGIPAIAAPIRVEYTLTRGLEGNIAAGTAEDPVLELASALVVAGRSVTLSVTNTAATGGDDEQSLEEALDLAPRHFAARDVAVTKTDYLALANGFADPIGGRVAAAAVFVPRAANQDVTLQLAVSNILGAINDQVPPVEAAHATLAAAQASATAAAATVTTEATTLAANATTAQTALQTAATGLRSVVAQSAQVVSDCLDATTQTTTARNSVNGIATAGADQLTSGTKDALLAALGIALARLSSASTAAGTVQSTTPTVQSSVAEALGQLQTGIGTAATPLSTGTPLQKIVAAKDAITTALGAQTAPLAVIDATVVDGTTGTAAAVKAILDALQGHFDAVLADEGRSNHVQLPILVRDAGGFYAAPSVALMRGLQQYLEARCDVTHTVEVVSGVSVLVPAVLSCHLYVRAGYDLDAVSAVATAAVNALVRRRRFGESLHVSELVTVLLGVEGVSHATASILGHLQDGSTVGSKLDAYGTLTVSQQEVVTRGSLTVTAAFEVAR